MATLRIPILAASAVVAMGLAGCTGEPLTPSPSPSASHTLSPSVTPSALPSPTPTPSASPSPSATPVVVPVDPTDPAFWVITPTGLGPMSTDMSVEDLSEYTGVDYSQLMADVEAETDDRDRFHAACGQWRLGPDQPLASLAVMLANPGEDFDIGVFVVEPPWGDSYTDLPRTADGLGVDSTEAEVEAVYGSELQRRDNIYEEDAEQLWIEQDGHGIRFDTNSDDVVTAVNSGRVPDILYLEWCG